ncbi:MAG TPA: efflux RND transporter periplasmic adaptor subunit [Candidatus Baltobacteraceae bacterium]|nr:efflux RND transporter periplasmic adaptor subunit [Candidatus Baltobacteraceae bacterium]
MKIRPFSQYPRYPIALATAVLIVGMAVAGCSVPSSGQPQATTAKQANSIPVTAATVESRAVPVQVNAIGNVQASSRVTIKTRVDGPLTQIAFREGQEVKSGDPLFVIDPCPFQIAQEQAQAKLGEAQAMVRRAQANLARDQAQLKYAQIEERRYDDLVRNGDISQQQYDLKKTAADAAQATVAADGETIANAMAAVQAAQEAVEAARLQLSYTTIHSPIAGQTGPLLVHLGAIVKNNATSLVVINQIHPTYVAFAVPEQHLPEIKQFTAQHPLKVEVFVPNTSTPLAQGTLTFIDNTVDQATGTIQLKATFSNPQNTLWPGQFVNVVLTLRTVPNATVVPGQSVQTGQQGQFVYVIRPDQTVESRPVAVSRTAEPLSIIAKGLSPGEQVVTDGQVQLHPGARVSIQPTASVAAAGGSGS